MGSEKRLSWVGAIRFAIAMVFALAVMAGTGCGGSTGDSGTELDTAASGATAATETSVARIVSGAARAQGRRACEGASPLEVAKRYELPARRAGMKKEFTELSADPTASVEASPGYPRLVAAVYAATLPAAQRAAGAAGCAEELARSMRDG